MVQLVAIQCDEDGEDLEEYNGTRDIHGLPTSQETVVGGKFWTDSFFANPVGKQDDEAMIGKYVKNQRDGYHKLHSNHQFALF